MPRPTRAASARRRAATRAVSIGRPMPGSSGTGVHAPSGGAVTAGGAGRLCAARAVASAAPQVTRNGDRIRAEATARAGARQLDATSARGANYAMTLPSALEARVTELERERKHLLAVIEILKEVST